VYPARIFAENPKYPAGGELSIERARRYGWRAPSMDKAVARLEILYREVGPSLMAYLRRGFGDVQAAEDLLQETFVQAARRMERLSQAASPRAWLFAVARNLAVTARRRRRVVQPLPAELPGAEVAEDRRMEAVREAMGTLPSALRETLELRLRDGLSYEELADVLDVPVGTIRSRLHHALRRLRMAVTGVDA
jgi:RNA polymerase sigma-70 factor (ECF subfamily)